MFGKVLTFLIIINASLVWVNAMGIFDVSSSGASLSDDIATLKAGIDNFQSSVGNLFSGEGGIGQLITNSIDATIATAMLAVRSVILMIQIVVLGPAYASDTLVALGMDSTLADIFMMLTYFLWAMWVADIMGKRLGVND